MPGRPPNPCLEGHTWQPASAPGWYLCPVCKKVYAACVVCVPHPPAGVLHAYCPAHAHLRLSEPTPSLQQLLATPETKPQRPGRRSRKPPLYQQAGLWHDTGTPAAQEQVHP